MILFFFHFPHHLQLFDESFDRINEREQTSNLDRPVKTKFIEKREGGRGETESDSTEKCEGVEFGLWGSFFCSSSFVVGLTERENLEREEGGIW